MNKRTGAPNRPTPVNNARDDKLMSPYGMWCEWFVQPAQRCIIPFTAFAEAEGPVGAMTKTWISVADQPLAAWAGLWRPTDDWGDCYTGVMVDAAKELCDNGAFTIRLALEHSETCRTTGGYRARSSSPRSTAARDYSGSQREMMPISRSSSGATMQIGRPRS